MNKTSKIILWIVILALLATGVVVLSTSVLNTSKAVTFDTFVEYVENNGDTAATGDPVIVAIKVKGYKLYGYTENRVCYTTVGPSAFTGTTDSFIYKWINDYNVSVEFSDPNSGNIWSTVFTIGGLVLVCVIFAFMIRAQASGGTKGNSFAKTKARITSNVKTRFSDVAGAEEEKLELAEIVDFLRSPRKFFDLGARTPKGVLLVGPPGTGKTLFAKAIAGEAGVPFFSVSGSDFVEMFVGVGASRVRDLFETAKKNQPCIIFIDEIDAVGRQRGSGIGGGHDEREQTLNQILVQMDGFEGNDGVIVVAATNRADILDPALLRPGRFDRQIYVNLPDVKGREAILKVHARNKKFTPDVNFKIIARMTSGFSGADLANLLNEAAILAARANKNAIGSLELYEAVNKVIMGPQKKSHVVTESDKRCTAYHESGHAILARLCKKCDNVQEVSIIPRGKAAGYTLTRPETDDQDLSVGKLTDMICMTLGGRVAEELVIQDVTAGASSDLQRVTQIARKMVTEWGMSEKVGLVTYKSDNPVFLGRDMGTHEGYSDQTAAVIDSEVRNIIETQHARAVQLLQENRSILDNMARVLIEKETIYTEEVDMLMAGKTYGQVITEMDNRDIAASIRKKFSGEE